MSAGKFADAYGCMPGHVLQTADGIAAYPQAEMKGNIKTWIRIPAHRQPEHWKNLGIRDPVVCMDRTLYGHPDAGGIGKTLRSRTKGNRVHPCGNL